MCQFATGYCGAFGTIVRPHARVQRSAKRLLTLGKAAGVTSGREHMSGSARTRRVPRLITPPSAGRIVAIPDSLHHRYDRLAT